MGGGEVIDIYVCSVTCIDNEFKIGMKNFTVMSEAKDGNIFEAKVLTNLPVTPEALEAPEAPTATPEAQELENEEAQASIFNAVMTVQPCRVALTPDDLVDL